MTEWISMVSGNTRLHWGLFEGDELIRTWHTPHSSDTETKTEIFDKYLCGKQGLQVFGSGVAPKQHLIWQNLYEHFTVLEVAQQIPGQYDTMGHDRVLCLLGAIEIFNAPVLVVDAGTAITYNAVDDQGVFRGGAILPGLTTQLKSLYEKTEKLPMIPVPENLPGRFVLDTPTAIQSGVVYHALAGVKDYVQEWCKMHPGTSVIFTGGDGEFLFRYSRSCFEQNDIKSCYREDIMHYGVKKVVYRKGLLH